MKISKELMSNHPIAGFPANWLFGREIVKGSASNMLDARNKEDDGKEPLLALDSREMQR